MSRPADRCDPCRGTGLAYPTWTGESSAVEACAWCVRRGERLHPRAGDRVRFIYRRAKPARLRVGWWVVLEDAEDMQSMVLMRAHSSGYTRRWDAWRVAVVRTSEEQVAYAVMGDES